ncbi:hypothetical protein GCM10007199_06900 [Fictibacillus barbaricus]|nr:hypothetical protein GCM10007199_06900 [Fictibacillus barbaricus]
MLLVDLYKTLIIIYSYFGFKEDMYKLIYYHPIKEEMIGTPEDAQKKLEREILDFVNKQRHLFVSHSY